MIEHSVVQKTCITYNRSDNLKAAKCNSSDPLQKWIWTRHNQLLHVDTLKCIQQGQEYSGTNYTWYLGLEECNISETKQKWNCFDYLLQKPFSDSLGRPRSIRITQEKYTTILAKLDVDERWKRYGPNLKTICSSCMLPSSFTLSFMIINVLYFFIIDALLLLGAYIHKYCTYARHRGTSEILSTSENGVKWGQKYDTCNIFSNLVKKHHLTGKYPTLKVPNRPETETSIYNLFFCCSNHLHFNLT